MYAVSRDGGIRMKPPYYYYFSPEAREVFSTWVNIIGIDLLWIWGNIIQEGVWEWESHSEAQ